MVRKKVIRSESSEALRKYITSRTRKSRF